MRKDPYNWYRFIVQEGRTRRVENIIENTQQQQLNMYPKRSVAPLRANCWEISSIESVERMMGDEATDLYQNAQKTNSLLGNDCNHCDRLIMSWANSKLSKNMTQLPGQNTAQCSIDDYYAKSIIDECSQIRDLSLRVNAMVRDIYFAGMNTELASLPVEDLVEIMSTKMLTGASDFALFNIDPSVANNSENGFGNGLTDTTANDVIFDEQHVRCVYCMKVKASHIDLEFVIHPYVPITFKNDTIFMCMTCMDNWKEYRDKAEHEFQLILDGQVNEELCCLCSDTPETLVLCSNCPRSFCPNCLSKILDEKEMADTRRGDEVDWFCMCCVHCLDPMPPLAMDCWRIARVSSSSKTAGDGLNGHGPTTPSHSINSSTPARCGPAVGTPSTSARPSPSAERLRPSPPHNQDEEFTIIFAKPDNPPSLVGPLVKKRKSPGPGTRGSHSALDRDYSGDHDKDEDKDAEAPLHGGRRIGTRASSSSSHRLQAASDSPPPPPAPMAVATSSKSRKSSHHPRSNALNYADDCADDTVLPPVNKELDEVFYFSQYTIFYDRVCLRSEAGGPGSGGPKRTAQPSDDVCFLCKDGGDLVECDWVCGRNKKIRCRKVYHTYCLAYQVPESKDKWNCPRHFCDVCASASIVYMCKYCPISLCLNCPEQMVKKVRYLIGKVS